MKDDRACHTHFVFSHHEYETLCKKAKQCGLSKSVYLRRLILDKPVKARPPEAIHELYVEINRIGTNINQIARGVNSGLGTLEDVRQALFLLNKVYELVERAVND
ncbi:MAG: MobC family plasmid mobilization relaxosome protein [Bacillota bacterium]